MTPQSSAPRQGATGTPAFTPRRVAMLAVAAYAVLLALLNLGRVRINFVLFRTEASLIVVILLALALGFLAGWLFDDVRGRKRRDAA